MKFRFSIFTFLMAIAFLAVYFAGYQSGKSTGMKVMHKLGTRIEVFAAIQHVQSGSDRLLQRSFTTNQNETSKIEGNELGDLFVEITPYRVSDNDVEQEPITSETTIELKNISVAELKKQIQETMPKLVRSNSVAFDAASNSIIVKNGSPETMKNIAALAAFSDKRPPIYKAKMRIGRNMPDGSQIILHEPIVTTLEKLPAKFVVGSLKEKISVCLRFDDSPLSSF